MAVGCKQSLSVCAARILAGSSLAFGACGLFLDASANEAELEAKIALCVGIPVADVDLSLDDDGNYAGIGITHPQAASRLLDEAARPAIPMVRFEVIQSDVTSWNSSDFQTGWHASDDEPEDDYAIA